MSENESTEDEGYVIEGNTEIATRGHLAIYSVTSGRVDYSSFVQVARSLELTRPFVPEIRRLKDSFAIARGNLEGLTLPPLEVAEGWDSQWTEPSKWSRCQEATSMLSKLSLVEEREERTTCAARISLGWNSSLQRTLTWLNGEPPTWIMCGKVSRKKHKQVFLKSLSALL